MLSSDIIKEVYDTFGSPNYPNFQYLWIAKVTNYYKQPIIIATLKMEYSLKGLLYIATKPNFLGEVKEPSSIRVLNLDHQTDSVKQALQSINILPDDDSLVFDGTDLYTFSFEIHTQKMITKLHYGPGGSSYFNINNLWFELIKTIESFSRLYNDKDITKAVLR